MFSSALTLWSIRVLRDGRSKPAHFVEEYRALAGSHPSEIILEGFTMSKDAIPYDYTAPPACIRTVIDEAVGRLTKVDGLVAELPETPPRTPDEDGSEERLGGVTVTHRFVDAPVAARPCAGTSSKPAPRMRP